MQFWGGSCVKEKGQARKHVRPSESIGKQANKKIIISMRSRALLGVGGEKQKGFNEDTALQR